MGIGNTHQIYAGKNAIAIDGQIVVKCKETEKQKGRSVSVPHLSVSQDVLMAEVDFIQSMLRDAYKDMVLGYLADASVEVITDEMLTFEALKRSVVSKSSALTDDEIKEFCASQLPDILAVWIEIHFSKEKATPDRVQKAVAGATEKYLLLSGKKRPDLPADTRQRLVDWVSVSEDATAKKLLAKLAPKERKVDDDFLADALA